MNYKDAGFKEYKALGKAIDEANRFLAVALDFWGTNPVNAPLPAYSPLRAETRRASMDLTKALARFRGARV